MKLSGFGSVVLAITLIITSVVTLHAQGTAFTYQGRLNNNGTPANGNYDFRFRLATDKDGNNYVGSTILTNGLAVSNGLFTATIDFGPGLFTGTSYWLQIDVRATGGGVYTTLNPLQTVTPSPYSIFATTASAVTGSVSASQLTGAVGSANISGTYGSAVTLNNPNNNFSGNGANVSNVNAAALSGLASSNFWRLGGNGVGSTNDFIGSTNNQSVVVKVNNKQAVRYEDSSDTPNIVGGYSGNLIATNVPGGTIGGGGTVLGNQPNIITNGGDYGTIAGGYRNFISGYGGAVLGGSVNSVSNSFGVVGGGQWNAIGSGYSFIGGGYSNLASLSYYSAIVGGYFNTNFSYAGMIGAGANNSIGTNSTFGFIGGGWFNSILTNSSYGSIAGGYLNVVGPNAPYGTVAGGDQNQVTAPYGFAAGTGARANHSGSLVMTDGQQAGFPSITENEFAIRAQNGLRLESDVGIHLNYGDRPIITRDWDPFATNAPSYKVGIGRWGLFMEPGVLTLGIPDLGGRSFQVAKYSTNGDYSSLMSVDQYGNVYASAFVGTNQSVGFLGTFTGNGGSLTNVNATTLDGLDSSSFALLNSSPSFSGTVTANGLTVSNTARITGLIRVGSETGTSEIPSPAGLVFRRINSTNAATNTVVAVARTFGDTANISLMRDGTTGGFIIKYPATPGNLTIACMGIDSTGAQKNFYTTVASPGSAGLVQIYTTAQNIVHFECTFGITYSASQHLTQVTLSRYGTDFYWSGNVVSTVNQ